MTLIRPQDTALIRDVRLRGLFGYWRSKLQGRSMPARRDIDPVEMGPWLGNLVLVEFPEDPMRYRIRLDGVNIAQFYGKSRQGMGIEAITSEEERRIIVPQYLIVVERGLPAYYESEFQTSEGILTAQRKLLLPLSEDGKRINMILGGLYFDQTRS